MLLIKIIAIPKIRNFKSLKLMIDKWRIQSAGYNLKFQEFFISEYCPYF